LNKNPTSTTSASIPYEYKEDDFRKDYDEALLKIKDGAIPNQPVPTEPTTGFAIISLSKEIYGVDAFAVLPISYRALSEEELLQLAYGMNGIPFDDLLSPTYSYINVDSHQINRPFYQEERIAKYKLDASYCFENLRPKEVLANKQLDGNPFFVEIPINQNNVFRSYCFFPVASMTEEQLLQYTDFYFGGDKNKEYYQPLEHEIQYKDTFDVAKKYAKAYGLSKHEIDNIYVYYSSGRSPYRTDTVNSIWRVLLHYKDDFDYSIDFSALDGHFLNWKRYPKGYLSEELASSSNLNQPSPTNISYSYEDIQRAAENYILEYIVEDGVQIKEAFVSRRDDYTPDYGLEFKGNDLYKNISVTLTNDFQCNVQIIANDLSVYGFSN